MVTVIRGKITTLMTSKLSEKGKIVAEQIVAARATLGKADDDEVSKLIAAVTLDWKDIADEMAPLLEAIAKDGVAQGAAQLEAIVGVSLDQANDRAVAYANNRAAEMVGMQRRGDKLAPNPNAHWAITDSTRNMIRADVVRALEEGWSNETLAAKLEGNYAFSADRAVAIARTETAIADVEGNMAAYMDAEEQGVTVLKKWITANDDKVSEDCAMNGKAKPRPLKKAFPSGVMNPPEHPRCRCDVLPVVMEDEE